MFICLFGWKQSYFWKISKDPSAGHLSIILNLNCSMFLWKPILSHEIRCTNISLKLLLQKSYPRYWVFSWIMNKVSFFSANVNRSFSCNICSTHLINYMLWFKIKMILLLHILQAFYFHLYLDFQECISTPSEGWYFNKPNDCIQS